MCFVTGNSNGIDVDQGIAVLTSPILDASETNMVLSYYRWYDTSVAGADNLIVEFSINGGGSWEILEIVQPIVTGSWVLKSFDLDSIFGFVPTSQFRIRFRAFDQGADQTIEAAVDGITIEKLVCVEPCPADVAGGDGVVNITDLLFVISHWGGGAGDPADVNGDNTVNITDLLAVISAWGACP
jgi:hypothetical protein